MRDCLTHAKGKGTIFKVLQAVWPSTVTPHGPPEYTPGKGTGRFWGWKYDGGWVFCSVFIPAHSWLDPWHWAEIFQNLIFSHLYNSVSSRSRISFSWRVMFPVPGRARLQATQGDPEAPMCHGHTHFIPWKTTQYLPGQNQRELCSKTLKSCILVIWRH